MTTKPNVPKKHARVKKRESEVQPTQRPTTGAQLADDNRGALRQPSAAATLRMHPAWKPPPRPREDLVRSACHFGWLPMMPLTGPLSDADIETGDQRLEAWLRLQRAKRDAGLNDKDRQAMGSMMRRLNAVLSNIHPDNHPHGESDLRLLVIHFVVSWATAEEPHFYFDDARDAWFVKLVGDVIERCRTFAPEYAAMLDEARDTVLYAMNAVRNGNASDAVYWLNAVLGMESTTKKSAAQTYKKWVAQFSSRVRGVPPPSVK